MGLGGTLFPYIEHKGLPTFYINQKAFLDFSYNLPLNLVLNIKDVTL